MDIPQHRIIDIEQSLGSRHQGGEPREARMENMHSSECRTHDLMQLVAMVGLHHSIGKRIWAGAVLIGNKAVRAVRPAPTQIFANGLQPSGSPQLNLLLPKRFSTQYRLDLRCNKTLSGARILQIHRSQRARPGQNSTTGGSMSRQRVNDA